MRGNPRGYRLLWEEWPAADRAAWQQAFDEGDWLVDDRPGADLAEATRLWLRSDYASLLGFLAVYRPELLAAPPHARLNREVTATYVDFLRPQCAETTVVMMLRGIITVLGYFAPDVDFTWLKQITNRLASTARPLPKRIVASDALSALGHRLMREAVQSADAGGIVTKQGAAQYRDGLIIAFLAAIPLRRGSLVRMRIGEHLVRSADGWRIHIPAGDTKTRRKLDYTLASRLARAVDLYLERFRPRINGAHLHTGVWPSRQGIPLVGVSLYEIVTKRTRAEFGFAVAPHRFRHGAATYVSERDPANVRMAKDVLGHATFATTEGHYVMAQSRIAGHRLAAALRESGTTGAGRAER
jgi:integrase